jgi:hypothetical protein
MDPSKNKSMWSNLRALKMKNVITIFINSIRRSMGLNKLLEYGMNAIILGSIKLTQLFSHEKISASR